VTRGCAIWERASKTRAGEGTGSIVRRIVHAATSTATVVAAARLQAQTQIPAQARGNYCSAIRAAVPAFPDRPAPRLAHVRDLRIITAYFLPTRRVRRYLTPPRECGRVQLIWRQIRRAALATGRAQLVSSFAKAGVEIYEYQPQILHAK